MDLIRRIVFAIYAILESTPWTNIALYLIFVNIITFCMYYADKQAAIERKWRIPEGTLHVAMIIGGTVGAIIAQQKFRHKTRKTSFQIVFRSLLLLQLLIITSFLFKDSIF